jgi:hypothetical protein
VAKKAESQGGKAKHRDAAAAKPESIVESTAPAPAGDAEAAAPPQAEQDASQQGAAAAAQQQQQQTTISTSRASSTSSRPIV